MNLILHYLHLLLWLIIWLNVVDALRTFTQAAAKNFTEKAASLRWSWFRQPIVLSSLGGIIGLILVFISG